MGWAKLCSGHKQSHISLLATTKVHFLFTKNLLWNHSILQADSKCSLNGNSLYRWEVKAKENGGVSDMEGEKQGGVKDDPLRLVKLHG